MSSYKIYESPNYTVTRNGPGVDITQTDGVSTWLQGDEANQLEDLLEAAFGDNTDHADHMLSQYFD